MDSGGVVESVSENCFVNKKWSAVPHIFDLSIGTRHLYRRAIKS